MSSFQCRAIERFRPRWAAILNISPDHLDWHADFDEYARSKLRLTVNCTEGDWLVYGADDASLRERLGATRARQVPFGLRQPAADVRVAAWEQDGSVRWRSPDGDEQEVIASIEIGALGRHNVRNACAASALALLAGADPGAARRALRTFAGLEHRMERCGEPRGVLCVNDSKATNVDATVAALTGFANGVWLILGGRDKKGDFNRLRPLLRGRVRGVLSIGESAGRIAASLHGAIRLERCETMGRAVDRGLQLAMPGDVLLLSPACTSFDQYDDFEQRGRDFKAHVARHTVGGGTASERG
jgi:UDP-N-acetylmuramoylalanine--D-glutamate ligase